MSVCVVIYSTKNINIKWKSKKNIAPNQSNSNWIICFMPHNAMSKHWSCTISFSQVEFAPFYARLHLESSKWSEQQEILVIGRFQSKNSEFTNYVSVEVTSSSNFPRSSKYNSNSSLYICSDGAISKSKLTDNNK